MLILRIKYFKMTPTNMVIHLKFYQWSDWSRSCVTIKGGENRRKLWRHALEFSGKVWWDSAFSLSACWSGSTLLTKLTTKEQNANILRMREMGFFQTFVFFSISAKGFWTQICIHNFVVLCSVMQAFVIARKK